MTYDVVVIWGGHNGLTAAAYLARAGRQVLVLERRRVLGGAPVTEEVFKGFRFSVCSYVVSVVRGSGSRGAENGRYAYRKPAPMFRIVSVVGSSRCLQASHDSLRSRPWHESNLRSQSFLLTIAP